MQNKIENDDCQIKNNKKRRTGQVFETCKVFITIINEYAKIRTTHKKTR